MRSLFSFVSAGPRFASVGLQRSAVGVDNNPCGLQNFNDLSVGRSYYFELEEFNDASFSTALELWPLVCGRHHSDSGFQGTLILTTFERSRDYWARHISQNKDVKVYIAALGAPGHDGTGYVPVSTLSSIAVQMRQNYPSFGGVMVWDASQAYGE